MEVEYFDLFNAGLGILRDPVWLPDCDGQVQCTVLKRVSGWQEGREWVRDTQELLEIANLEHLLAELMRL